MVVQQAVLCKQVLLPVRMKKDEEDECFPLWDLDSEMISGNIIKLFHIVQDVLPYCFSWDVIALCDIRQF